MFYFKLIMVTFIFFWGCSSTHLLKHNKSDYNALNKKMYDEECEIILSEDVIIKGKNIRIFKDSLYCIESKTDSEMVIHTSEIKIITVVDNSKGAWEGCGIGIITGLVSLGAIIIGPREVEPLGVILFSALLPLGGGMWGAIIGAIIGHDDKYLFETAPDTTITLLPKM